MPYNCYLLPPVINHQPASSQHWLVKTLTHKSSRHAPRSSPQKKAAMSSSIRVVSFVSKTHFLKYSLPRSEILRLERGIPGPTPPNPKVIPGWSQGHPEARRKAMTTTVVLWHRLRPSNHLFTGIIDSDPRLPPSHDLQNPLFFTSTVPRQDTPHPWFPNLHV